MKKIAAGMLSAAAMFAVSTPFALADTTSAAATATYTVQSGDSLWKISQKYNVSVNELATLNHLADPSQIYVGEVLKLPSTTYVVQSGDSVWKIAQKFGVSSNDIVSANHLTNANVLYVGQTLTIPAATVTTAATTASAPSASATTGNTTASSAATQTNSTADTRSVLADQIVATAQKYVGVPYVWGGTSPSGFDCSGYVYYVYQQNGITLPRVSADQYNAGTPVTQAQLQKGDLVFFSDTWTSGVSHVGIYIGNRQFLEESSGQGKVIVSTLDNPYWAAHYTGAKRVF